MLEAGFTILILEDDPNDVVLLQRALKKNSITNPIQVVTDGVEGIAYLKGQGKYADRNAFPAPGVIIMDLKMPRMGGLEVLEWLKHNPDFQVIPTLILSSSKLNDDIVKAYGLGANSYFVKPGHFEDLQSLIKLVHDYWSRCVKPAEGS